MDLKSKFIALFLSYSFFIIVIIISINAVVPEDDIPVLEQKEILIKKVDNKFSRDKSSVYDILEENDKSIKKEKISENKLKTKSELKKKVGEFRLQLSSFKEKQKSLEISKKLKQKFLNETMQINLIIKKVNLKNDQTFFRVLSENSYHINDAKDLCKKLEEIKIPCIIVKNK